MKRFTAPLFLLWTGVIVFLYYVVQKPSLLYAFAGLVDTLWTLLVAAILLFNAYGIGKRILGWLRFNAQDSIDHLLLSFGVGLGALGLLGLFFSAIQLASKNVLTVIQIALVLFFLWRREFGSLGFDLRTLRSSLNIAFSQYSFFTKLAIISLLIFSFLLTLVPPFEAFDALLYHLTLPATILQHGGLQAFNNPPFWFPSLSENVYLWALGMGSERASQVLHFAWAMLSGLLLWHWASKTWNAEIARKTLLLGTAIPSLCMLISWAYADMALVYYASASLYALTQFRLSKAPAWLNSAAITAGFAMGIKYTSFVVPLTCGLLLLSNRPLLKAIYSAAQFSMVALAVASPWYIRNAIFMGNPFYPFVFGGRYWDSFLAHWYGEAGTGIGWNPWQIILLPLNVTLGNHDITFFDGRIGPLFLLLVPLTVWILWTRIRRASDPAESGSLLAIGLFTLISFAAWTVGVINSSGLRQARLLFPAMLPFIIPTALAWDSLKQFDTSKLKISFFANALIAVVIALTIFENGYFVLQRNPLAVALGAQSRERYIERINPSYAALMQLMNELPADAQVYSLFEPRSYGLPRSIQADPLLYNFAHDVYLFRSSDAIIQHWKSEHYTHVVIYERGLKLTIDSPASRFTLEMQKVLEATRAQLKLFAQTPDKIYSVYKIP